jgi:WD40 repeat protein
MASCQLTCIQRYIFFPFLKGYLAAGTERGDIIVFDKGEVSMVWKEHNDNCHMLKWAKRGGRLLTASFDGTAKVWLLNS